MIQIPRLVMILAMLTASTALSLEHGASPAFAQAPAGPLRPPVAKRLPHQHEAHGNRRIDNYHWLRDRDDPAALAYLAAENDYATARLTAFQPLIKELEEEGTKRAAGASESPDFVNNGYVYQRRIAERARFPVIVRHRPQPGAATEIVLDIEALASGHEQYGLEKYLVSPDNARVAFAVDFTGGQSHRVFVREIATGHVTDTGIAAAASDLAFSADSKFLFYVRLAPVTLRSYQVWRHRLGSTASHDTLVYEEPDPTFELTLSTTKSRRYILLSIERQQSTEVRYLAADRPDEEFRIIEPRRHGVIYQADHLGDAFYIRTNLGAPDFRLVCAPEAAPQAASWIDVVAAVPGRFIAQFDVFDTFIAVAEEHDALRSVRVIRRSDGSEIAVPPPAEIGVMDMRFAQGAANRDPGATVLQLRFSGPARPVSYYDFDTRGGELALRKRSQEWRWFDPEAYEVRRIDAAAPDGAAVPVTLMYRKERFQDGRNPLLIAGYGAYGTSTLPRFSDTWISLIDRGFVYAIAHVRGGRERGSSWHDQGRMLNKRNSFTDFIAATEALIAQGLANPRQVFAHGESAGGLLVGAVANLRPDLYAGIVAEVPFVDVVTTMADPSLPLTTLEYEEWGNSAIREQYDYMLSYSPYDNVAVRAYPPMFVTAALHDTQVGYHEPAKWVALLRATKTDSNEILLVTDMVAGHTGIAGRFGESDDNARIMAWLIAMANEVDR
jgi:oligopeptidase B